MGIAPFCWRMHGCEHLWVRLILPAFVISPWYGQNNSSASHEATTLAMQLQWELWNRFLLEPRKSQDARGIFPLNLKLFFLLLIMAVHRKLLGAISVRPNSHVHSLRFDTYQRKSISFLFHVRNTIQCSLCFSKYIPCWGAVLFPEMKVFTTQNSLAGPQTQQGGGGCTNCEMKR